MTTGIARIGLFAVALILAIPAPTAAGPGSGTDPDDVVSRLDLKALSHADDGSAMTYTAETYEAFPDRSAAFKWGIDKNGDEGFDLVVFAEWDEGRLVAGVDDAKENKVASATVSRPAPNAITVSFPAAVLGGAAGSIPGQEIEHPMAVVILGGLLASTFINLFVVPSLYLRFGKSRPRSSTATTG